MKYKRSLTLLLATLLTIGAPAISFALNAGEKAPPFAGVSTQGEVALDAYKGKKNVILALYFAVFTPV